MKVLFVFLLVTFTLLLCASPVNADVTKVEYLVIIEDNGNVVVTISMEGSGLITVPVQEDVEEINVEGALYIKENDSIEISIGDTEEAFILYTTSMLTSKSGNEWNFDMPLANSENLEVTVAMPKDTNIMLTEPNAVIESGEILQLHWYGDMDEIGIKYYFDTDIGEIPEDAGNVLYSMGLLFTTAVVIAGIFIHMKRRKIRRIGKKQNIMNTLPPNEVDIVQTLMDNGGAMKRSVMERKLDIAKSSLAASLKNLERKNILEVDRTSASHYVRFTEWFNEL